jgi:hypothetical protein
MPDRHQERLALPLFATLQQFLRVAQVVKGRPQDSDLAFGVGVVDNFGALSISLRRRRRDSS